MSTGSYCTNCNKEFEPYDKVTVVHGGVIEPFYKDYWVEPDDSPNDMTLCEECGRKLLEPLSNRVVIEVMSGVVVAVRAERPAELHVTVLNRYAGNYNVQRKQKVARLCTIEEEA